MQIPSVFYSSLYNRSSFYNEFELLYLGGKNCLICDTGNLQESVSVKKGINENKVFEFVPNQKISIFILLSVKMKQEKRY